MTELLRWFSWNIMRPRNAGLKPDFLLCTKGGATKAKSKASGESLSAYIRVRSRRISDASSSRPGTPQSRFDKTMARAEIENRGTIHETENKKQWHQMPCPGRRSHGNVAIELCSIERPHEFFGRLSDRRLRRHHFVKG